MKKVIEKFVLDLEEKCRLLEKNRNTNKKLYIETIEVIKTAIDFLVIDKQELLEKAQMYTDFECFCMLLKSSTLSKKEQMDVILYVIEKNTFLLEHYPNLESNILDINTLKKIYAPKMNNKQIWNVLKRFNVQEINEKPEDKLSSEELALKQAIAKAIEENEKKHKLFVVSHHQIRNHYLSKKENYTEQDLKFIKVAFKYLNLDVDIQGYILRILEKKLQKRINKYRSNEAKMEEQKTIKKFTEYLEKKIQEFNKALDEEVHKLTIEYLKIGKKNLNEEDIAEILGEVISQYYCTDKYGFSDNKNTKYYLNLLIGKEREEKHIFGDYTFLCENMRNVGLRLSEKMIIVNQILKEELSKIKKSDLIIKYEGMTDLHPDVPTKLFKDFIYQGGLLRLFEKSEKEFSNTEKIVFDFLKENGKISEEDFEIILKLKKQLINGEKLDPENSVQAYQILGIPSNLCKGFGNLLKKAQSKENIVEERNKEKKIKENNYLTVDSSTKEYKLIFREIMEMYDIQDHKIIRALTKDEIIYLVSLMLKINIPEIEIRKSIQNINWHGIEAYNNPVTEFNYNYEKIERNSAIVEVEIAIRNIKEYIQAMIMPEDDTEYSFWKNQIEEELKKIRNILNQDDTYELEEGRKLNRINKGNE